MALKELTAEERETKANRLCNLLDCTPMYIFDTNLWMLFKEKHTDPIKMEKFLAYRGKPLREDESLKEGLERIYGKEATALAEELI